MIRNLKDLFLSFHVNNPRNILLKGKLLRPFSSQPAQRLEQQDAGLREYFFYIDYKGILYLDDSDAKNFTCALKDKRFLVCYVDLCYFWFKDVSECWGEFNYVRCSSKPVVFDDLDIQKNTLEYALCLTEAFNPSEIRKDKEGLLFHPVTLNDIGFGIFSTRLLMELSENIKIEGPTNMQLVWKGQTYDILDLPEADQINLHAALSS